MLYIYCLYIVYIVYILYIYIYIYCIYVMHIYIYILHLYQCKIDYNKLFKSAQCLDFVREQITD